MDVSNGTLHIIPVPSYLFVYLIVVGSFNIPCLIFPFCTHHGNNPIMEYCIVNIKACYPFQSCE